MLIFTNINKCIQANCINITSSTIITSMINLILKHIVFQGIFVTTMHAHLLSTHVSVHIHIFMNNLPSLYRVTVTGNKIR